VAVSFRRLLIQRPYVEFLALFATLLELRLGLSARRCVGQRAIVLRAERLLESSPTRLKPRE
jgi:hypothetical protein